MAVVSVGLARVDHYTYRQIDVDVPLLEWCRCGCGAVRDTRGVPDPTPFGVWAMEHEPPNGPPYYCSVCGTLALPINSYLIDGLRFVHRACVPLDGAA